MTRDSFTPYDARGPAATTPIDLTPVEYPDEVPDDVKPWTDSDTPEGQVFLKSLYPVKHTGKFGIFVNGIWVRPQKKNYLNPPRIYASASYARAGFRASVSKAFRARQGRIKREELSTLLDAWIADLESRGVVEYRNLDASAAQAVPQVPQVQFDRESLRRLVEFAYGYAWGCEGNADRRDAFRGVFNGIQKITGDFGYRGDGSFSWSDPAEEFVNE